MCAYGRDYLKMKQAAGVFIYKEHRFESSVRKRSMERVSFLLIVFCFCFVRCSSIDTITQTQFIKDPEFLVSKDGVFKLGFFSPNGSTHRYVGIWYNKPLIKVLWIANREKPLVDSSGVLRLSQQGNLVVLNGLNETLWSSNVSNSAVDSTVQLLDIGNLVLQSSSQNQLWRSSDHLSDNFYPKTRLSTNLRTGEKIFLQSWLSDSDPSYGNFTMTLVPLNIPEVFIYDRGVPYWRSGPWNGKVFIGIPFMNSVYLFWSMVVVGEGTTYLTFNSSYLTTIQISPVGTLSIWMWDDNKYTSIWFSKVSDCDVYGKCGAYASCDASASRICSCLRGFVPKNADEWNMGNWSGGCVRRSLLKCERIANGSANGKNDGFIALQFMKVPDFSERNNILEDPCRTICAINCSCLAYAFDSGIGCMTWSRELVDIQKFEKGTGTSLYIRVAYTELDKKKKNYKAVIIAVVVVGVVFLVIGLYLCLRRTTRKKRGRTSKEVPQVVTGAATETLPFSNDDIHSEHVHHNKLQELPLFSFEVVAKSTNNFNAANKLGQGGFGMVYMGVLEDGIKIAVKRLSASSGQGLKEFMTEVEVISKLQHINLVRLLGCCVEKNEKMLVYEYMPNKSLDVFLFDAQKKEILQWGKRFDIITGIGRGLVYLHRDSRPRIIHRDLKSSNILLDEDLNPKISDFGMARIFQSKQNQADTLRVVGTYGYMSPEYAMNGIFSEKSDVFSFGVLLLEIVSGRRNSSFHDKEGSQGLIGFAWKLWRDGNIKELVDAALLSSGAQEEILRCIQVGLLCVQDSAHDRPSVSTVLSMLSSEIAELPTPKQPGFVEMPFSDFPTSSFSSGAAANLCSTNDISVTKLQGR